MTSVIILFCLMAPGSIILFEGVYGLQNVPVPGPNDSRLTFHNACVLCIQSRKNFRANIKKHDNGCVDKNYPYGLGEDVVVVSDEKKCDVFLLVNSTNNNLVTAVPTVVTTSVPGVNLTKNPEPLIPKGSTGSNTWHCPSVNSATTLAIIEGIIIVLGLGAILMYLRRQKVAKYNFSKFSNDNLGFASRDEDDKVIDLSPI